MSSTHKKELDRELLEKLLDESKEIRGVSLWQDAWNRLRRNRTAMAAMVFLTVLAILALLTPLLPLQSPIDKDLNHRRFLSPNTAAVVMGSREELKFAEGRLTSELAAFHAEISELQSERDAATDPGERAARTEAITQRYKVEHPFNQLWNELGPVAWQLTRLRVALFGDYAVPSLFGTDILGRDLLARVFWGARVSLIVGIVATLVSLLIGVSYGAIAGYFGGWVDSVMMRIVDMMYSIPFIFVVIFLVT
ncbi:MAG: ABC transporter permease, partial [Novipirellula sp. JB048]